MKRGGLQTAVIDPLTLAGQDLREALRAHGFASSQIHLFHSQSETEGLLGEDDGGAAFVPPLSAGSLGAFHVAFLCGTRADSQAVCRTQNSGNCCFIDLSGLRTGGALALPFEPLPGGRLLLLPQPAAAVLAQLVQLLTPLGKVLGIRAVIDRPVSELGKKALDELFAQSVALASFAPLPKSILKTQSVFSFSYPPDTDSWESEVLEDFGRLTANQVQLSIQSARAGVFHGHHFRLELSFEGQVPAQEAVTNALSAKGSGFEVRDPADLPGLIEAAGNDDTLVLRTVCGDRSARIALAADLLRRPLAMRAVQIAEQLAAERGLVADA